MGVLLLLLTVLVVAWQAEGAALRPANPVSWWPNEEPGIRKHGGLQWDLDFEELNAAVLRDADLHTGHSTEVFEARSKEGDKYGVATNHLNIGQKQGNAHRHIRPIDYTESKHHAQNAAKLKLSLPQDTSRKASGTKLHIETDSQDSQERPSIFGFHSEQDYGHHKNSNEHDQKNYLQRTGKDGTFKQMLQSEITYVIRTTENPEGEGHKKHRITDQQAQEKNRNIGVQSSDQKANKQEQMQQEPEKAKTIWDLRTGNVHKTENEYKILKEVQPQNQMKAKEQKTGSRKHVAEKLDFQKPNQVDFQNHEAGKLNTPNSQEPTYKQVIKNKHLNVQEASQDVEHGAAKQNKLKEPKLQKHGDHGTYAAEKVKIEDPKLEKWGKFDSQEYKQRDAEKVNIQHDQSAEDKYVKEKQWQQVLDKFKHSDQQNEPLQVDQDFLKLVLTPEDSEQMDPQQWSNNWKQSDGIGNEDKHQEWPNEKWQATTKEETQQQPTRKEALKQHLSDYETDKQQANGNDLNEKWQQKNYNNYSKGQKQQQTRARDAYKGQQANEQKDEKLQVTKDQKEDRKQQAGSEDGHKWQRPNTKWMVANDQKDQKQQAFGNKKEDERQHQQGYNDQTVQQQQGKYPIQDQQNENKNDQKVMGWQNDQLRDDYFKSHEQQTTKGEKHRSAELNYQSQQWAVEQHSKNQKDLHSKDLHSKYQEQPLAGLHHDDQNIADKKEHLYRDASQEVKAETRPRNAINKPHSSKQNSPTPQNSESDAEPKEANPRTEADDEFRQQLWRKVIKILENGESGATYSSSEVTEGSIMPSSSEVTEGSKKPSRKRRDGNPKMIVGYLI